MISFADNNDIVDLKKLWHVSFGDDYDYIDFFFKNRFKEKECVVYRENGAPVSMLFVFDCFLPDNHKGKYIYAACTLPQFRAKGIMGKLIKYCSDYFLQSGYDFLCLVPASESLFQYYSRFGFKPFFKQTCKTLINQNKLIEKYDDLSFDDFVLKRNELLANGVRWDIESLKYAFDENLFRGGKNVSVGEGYALFREEDGVCTVIECAGIEDEKTFFSLTQCEKIIVRLPDKLNGKHNAMILTENNEIINNYSDMFLSLILD